MNYGTVVVGSWGIFILVWVVMALGAKRDVRGGGTRWWPARVAIAAIIASIAVYFGFGSLLAQSSEIPLQGGLFSTPPLLGWIAAVLTILGIAIAIWARVYLGRNWSATPAVKERHELITSGPYAYVRHPIYTGILLAAFGSMLTMSVFALAILVCLCIMFFPRIGREEKIMLELFPNEYPAYQARTKRLIPFVW